MAASGPPPDFFNDTRGGTRWQANEGQLLNTDGTVNTEIQFYTMGARRSMCNRRIA